MSARFATQGARAQGGEEGMEEMVQEDKAGIKQRQVLKSPEMLGCA